MRYCAGEVTEGWRSKHLVTRGPRELPPRFTMVVDLIANKHSITSLFPRMELVSRMNDQKRIRRIIAVVVAGAAISTTSQAQGLGGALSGAQAQTQQRVQQQVQAQVQQRVQGQVQNQIQSQVQAQVQAQVQQRVQAQIAGNVTARVNNQIEATARQAARLAARAQATGKAASSAALSAAANTHVDASANANVRGNAHIGQNQIATSSNTQARIGVSAAPIQITHSDVAVYDSIFGQFNPLRTAAMIKANAQGHTHAAAGTATGIAAAGQAHADAAASNAAAESGNLLTSGEAAIQSQGSASAQAQTQTHSHAGGEFGIAGILDANVDLSSMIAVAARQRRAEISQMRDQAIASANAELMAHADAMETQLAAFASAQQQAIAQTQGTAEAAAQSAASTNAAVNANANGSATVR